MKKRSKARVTANNPQPGQGNWHPLGLLVVLAGIVILIAGIYFLKHDISGQGVIMGLRGEPYRGASLDGYGLLFCGFIIFLFGLMVAAPKQKDQAGK